MKYNLIFKSITVKDPQYAENTARSIK